MAASNAELEARVMALESKVLGATEIPKGTVEAGDSKVPDKTGWLVFGEGIPGIHGGKKFQGFCTVAEPTLDAHFSKFIYREL